MYSAIENLERGKKLENYFVIWWLFSTYPIVDGHDWFEERQISIWLRLEKFVCCKYE